MATLEKSLNVMRKEGWLVAVHNDYILDGEQKTFWLFTHPAGIFVKGEATTDAEALAICACEAARAVQKDG